MMQMCCKVASPSSEQRCRIEKIAALTPCRRGFVCLASPFQDLGRLQAVEVADAGANGSYPPDRSDPTFRTYFLARS
jgi:hypothetical protein